MNWYVDVLKNYVGFSGRARRQEYWMFVLVNLGIVIVLDVIGLVTKLPEISYVYGVAVFLPGLAVAFRRMHDIGRSAWWLLIILVPLVGAIVLLVFAATEGVRGDNAYGPDPKAAVART